MLPRYLEEIRMRALRFLRIGLVAAPIALTAGLALAGDPPVTFEQCTREPTAADVEGAKGAHKAATQFFERGDYDRAIQYWRDAYSFDCTKPAILLNIANAYEKKGDRAAAVATLEAYLARAPNGADAPTIQEKVKNLKASMQPAPASSGTTAPAGTATAAPTGTVEPPAPPPPTEAVGERPFGVTPLIVAGAGGAMAIVGAILWPVGLGKVSDAEDACPNRQNCPKNIAEAGNSGRTQATVGGVLVGVGVAALAGGLAWQLGFNHAKKVETATALHVAPSVGPGGATLSLSGRF
jgi:tetratricopeptide (TPR) repeat protein